MLTLNHQLQLASKGTTRAVVDLTLPTPVQGWSYAHLAAQVEVAARFLSSRGVTHGTVVAIAIVNSIDFVVAFLAVGSLGAVAAPLNSTYKQAEFDFYLEDSQSKFFIVNALGNETGEEVAKKRNLNIIELNIDEKNGEVLLWEKSGTRPTDQKSMSQAEGDVMNAGPDEVCLVLHTSGTTSRPKAVPLTHKNLCTSIDNIRNTYQLTATDCTILVMPLFHVHGLMCALLSSLLAGSSIIIPKDGKFSASTFWKDVAEWKVNWFTAVPTIHQVLLLRASQDYPQPPPSLRFIRSCSSPLAASVLLDLEKAFGAPVLEAYAMTEASHQMTSNPLPSVGPRKPGTVGVGQNVAVGILDNDCKVLGPNQVGEVCINGANVTAGYLNNPSANLDAFAGGWFHTGDQGKIDEEGYLTLVGRIKELINRGGEKISPVELDSFLLGHPDVAEAVAFAVPDEKYGEEVNAAVVLKEGAKVDENNLKQFCDQTLAAFKVPKKFFITDSLPKTSTGKIQRRFVAEHFLKQK